jgi:hypothetical protein
MTSQFMQSQAELSGIEFIRLARFLAYNVAGLSRAISLRNVDPRHCSAGAWFYAFGIQLGSDYVAIVTHAGKQQDAFEDGALLWSFGIMAERIYPLASAGLSLLALASCPEFEHDHPAIELGD